MIFFFFFLSVANRISNTKGIDYPTHYPMQNTQTPKKFPSNSSIHPSTQPKPQHPNYNPTYIPVQTSKQNRTNISISPYSYLYKTFDSRCNGRVLARGAAPSIYTLIGTHHVMSRRRPKGLRRRTKGVGGPL